MNAKIWRKTARGRVRSGRILQDGKQCVRALGWHRQYRIFPIRNRMHRCRELHGSLHLESLLLFTKPRIGKRPDGPVVVLEEARIMDVGSHDKSHSVGKERNIRGIIIDQLDQFITQLFRFGGIRFGEGRSYFGDYRIRELDTDLVGARGRESRSQKRREAGIHGVVGNNHGIRPTLAM